MPKSFLTLRTVSSSLSTLGRMSMDRRLEVEEDVAAAPSGVGVSAAAVSRETAASSRLTCSSGLSSVAVLVDERPRPPVIACRSVIRRGSLSPISLGGKHGFVNNFFRVQRRAIISYHHGRCSSCYNSVSYSE
jgi:hypothetical protein